MKSGLLWPWQFVLKAQMEERLDKQCWWAAKREKEELCLVENQG